MLVMSYPDQAGPGGMVALLEELMLGVKQDYFNSKIGVKRVNASSEASSIKHEPCVCETSSFSAMTGSDTGTLSPGDDQNG